MSHILEEFNNLVKVVDAHAKAEGIIMGSQSVYNFIDHIAPEDGNCEECRSAVVLYLGYDIFNGEGMAV